VSREHPDDTVLKAAQSDQRPQGGSGGDSDYPERVTAESSRETYDQGT
jgi:hypothetical protein